ncbi:MAG TPA: DSD1 family PLP-dependent enzyme [Pararobbsia sp.]|nr:DSD1 family PLP-dependent enzyme [Pararobbsia sp.]
MLDLDVAMRNIQRLQAAANAAGVRLRPHAKAHKCPEIARLQIAAGAQGICCQKVSEAIPFIAAGIDDVHISNEVVGAQKVRQLAELARDARMSVCVDDALQIDALAAATVIAGSRLGVFIDIDVGQHRCGVASLEQAIALATLIVAHPQLELRGIQAYHGGNQHQRSAEQRNRTSAHAASHAAAIAQGLRAAGFRCETITGGGSGSAEYDFAHGVYTEIQAGSYVFMDADYASNTYEGALRFEHSLLIATTVMSVAVDGQVVVDAGLKSMSVDSGLPWLWEQGQRSDTLTYAGASDEHGVIRPIEHASSALPPLGTQLMLVPGHCDPTFNLYDRLVVVQNDRVANVWPVAARGMSW